VAGLPNKGSLLRSIELDYECLLAAATSVTATLRLVKRGVDGSVAVVSTPAITQDLTAATDAADEDQHKLTVTLTTPAYIENDEYYLCTFAFVCGGTVTLDVLAAVINYTARL